MPTATDFSILQQKFGDLSRFEACPPFWVPKPEQAMPMIEELKQATVRTIGRSLAGREIIALEYGDKEWLETQTDNLHSAIASKIVPCDQTEIFPSAFYGSKRRSRPVLVLQGGIHGGELTGTVASLNLCQIIETGKDLRGKAWPTLAETARGVRLLVIPWLNPDGVARWPLANPTAATGEMSSLCMHGLRLDGTPYRYPQDKAIQPIPLDKTAYMGAYYNDQGVNLQYDLCMPHRQPETIAWMEYYLSERPDGVVIWHCNAGTMMGPPEYYLPVGMQHEVSRLAGAIRSRILREGFNSQRGYPVSRLALAGLPSMGKPHIDQMTATYLVAGALPMMCELPSGGMDAPYSLDDMLDLGLITLEEILIYAHTDGLRPYETWEKTKHQMQLKKEKVNAQER